MLVRMAFLLLCTLILPVYGSFTYSYNLSSKEGTVTGYDGHQISYNIRYGNWFQCI